MAGNVAADLMVHVGADVGDATRGLSDVGNRVDSMSKGFQRSSMIMGGAALGIVGGLGLAVNSAMNYEQSIANITALGPEFASSQQQISDLALQIGQDTAFGAGEGAQAIEELAKAGVPLKDILAGAAMETANLASAGGQSMPEAATTMSNAMNMFGIAGSDAAMVADSFAAAANASAADVGQLSQALAQGGPAAAAMGMSLNETNGALALFSNYGIQGSDAGTSLKTMLMSLANPSQEAADTMAALGINAFDASGNFIGMEALAGQLQGSLSGLTQEQQQAALATIFGSDAMRVGNVLLQEGAEGVREMTDAVSRQGAAGEMAKAKMNTLNGALDQLKGSFETALIIVGSAFIPAIRGVADGLTGMMNKFLKLSKPLQKFIGFSAAAAAGALAIGAAITGIVGFAGPAIAGLMAIAAPILLLIGIGALLYAAWKTNFGGIRDIVGSVVDTVGGFLGDLISYFSEVSSGSRVMTDSLKKFPEPLQGIITILGAVVDAVTEFIHVIGKGGSLGEAWAEATDIFSKGPIQDALKGIPGDILNMLGMIPWGTIGGLLLSGLSAAASAIGSAAAWLLPKLGSLAVDLGNWLWEQASSVKWGELLASAASTAGDITGDIIGKLGPLGDKLIEWVTTAAAAVPWRSIIGASQDVLIGLVDEIPGKLGDIHAKLTEWWNSGTAVEWRNTLGAKMDDLRDIAAEIPGKLGNLAHEFDTWWRGAIDGVDWGNLGFVVGEKIGDLSKALAPKAGELAQGFLTAITNPSLWLGIATAIGAMIIALPASLIYLGDTLLPAAGEFIGGFYKGLGGPDWETVKSWLADLPNKALAAVPVLGEILLIKGQELISGIQHGLVNYWPDVSSWLANLGQAALDSIPDLLTKLEQKGQQLISGIYTGLTGKWPEVSSWLGTVGQLAFEAVTNLSFKLLDRGIQLMTGLKSGAVAFWDTTISPWLANVGNAAMQKIGSLLKTLYNRGLELLQGLRDGAAAKWVEFAADLGAIPGAVQAYFSDASGWLYSAGAAIIQGLINGIDSMLGWLDDKVATIVNKVKDIPGMLGIGSPSKLAIFWGEMVTKGIGIGLDKGKDNVAYKVDSLMRLFDVSPPTIQPDVVLGNSLPQALETMRMAASQSLQAFANVTNGTTVNQTIQVDVHVDELEDIVEAGRFVRDLPSSRQLYFGNVG